MKKYFLTGLATLLPLAVTIYVVNFVVGFLTHPFMGIVTNLLHRIGSLRVPEPIIRTASQLLILIGLFLFAILLGFVARWFFINALIRFGDRLMHKIPLFNKVYKTTKEIIQILFTSNKNSFKQVVLVRFPNRNCYCLGLITRESPQTCSQNSSEEMLSVFIPTTPNPMTGFLILSPKSELIYLDMKGDEAIKYVVSCGVIQPGNSEEM